MSDFRRVLRNATLSSGAGFVRMAASFLFFLYGSRKLGPTGWGTLRSAGALVDLFSRLGDLGCSTVTIRRIAKKPQEWPEALWTATWTRMALAVASSILPVLVGLLLQYPDPVMKLVYFLALAVVPTSLATSLLLVFSGLEQFHWATGPGVVTHVLYIAARLEAVRRGKPLVVLVLLTLVQALLLCSVSWAILARILGGRIQKASFASMARLLRESIPFAASGLLASLYWQVDMVMLQKLKDETEVGIYSAAYSFVNVGMRLCAGLGAALLPAFSRRAKGSARSLTAPFVLALKLSLILGLPAVLGVQLMGRDLLDFLLTSDYSESGRALSVLIWSVFFILMNTVLYNILYAVGKERIVILLFGCMLLVNVSVNALLIPKYSYMGAAGATVLCEVLNFLGCLLYLKERLSLKRPQITHLFLLLPGAAVGSCLYLTRTPLGLWAVPGGLAAFVATLPLCLLALTLEERRALRGLLPAGLPRS